ncbi:MAG TPA: hypothetical protein VGV92_04705 [Gammaproteobacteria bacterium]|nr:hypothetical protein [Gammaproteobacteria bacterium]
MNEGETKKKRISVVMVGNVHRDHGPPVMLLQLIKQLVKMGCNVVYCDEMTPDITLPLKIIFDTTNTQDSEEYRHLCHTDKEHAKPYFRLDDLEMINSVAKSRTRYDLIIGINAHTAEKTLCQYLFQTKIPYQGLEPPAAEWEEMQARFHEGHAVAEFEQQRAPYMAATLVEKVFPDLKENTIVICNIGVLHSHRVAANVLEQHAQAQDPSCNIKAIPLVCFSNYIDEEERTLLLNEIQEMRKSDPVVIAKRYSTLPTVQATALKETKDGNSFESEDFCKAFQEAAMFAKPPKMYFIPTTDKELITRQNGKVLQAKNGGLYASFRSCDLTAEKRKALGIERKQLTLDKNGAEKLELLRTRKEFIVIEETCIPHKFLVTFPPEQLDFVTKVASKEWRELLAKDTTQTKLKGPDSP